MNSLLNKIISENKKMLSNSKGATLIYILASFLTVSFVGTGMIKVSHHDVVASSDYASISSAASAARSGLLATESFFNNDGASIVKILNNYLDTATNYPILGNLANNEKVAIDNQHSFITELISFDKTNFNAHIRSYGFGKGNSAKRIDAVFTLSGIEYKVGEKNDWSAENVIYANCDVCILYSKSIPVLYSKRVPPMLLKI